MLVAPTRIAFLVGLITCCVGLIAWAALQVGSAEVQVASDGPVVVYTARKIITMDPARPVAAAVAVDAGRIAAVGSLAEVEAALSGRALRVDRRFASHVLLPGFIENHLHPALAGVLLPLAFVTPYDWDLPDRQVSGVIGRDAFLARMRGLEAAETDPEAWLIAWGHHPLFHGELARADLDALSTQRPILVWHRSFHEITVNTAALAALGIDEPLVAGNAQVDWPRGRFFETGLAVIFPRLAPQLLAPERFGRGLELGRQLLHRGGITTVSDGGFGLFDFELEWKLVEAVWGRALAPFRTILLVDGRTLGQRLGSHEAAREEIERLSARSHDRLRIPGRAVKLFADGAFYSLLMQMKEGYLDGHAGEWLMQPAELESAARLYWQHGYQIHVHVNGDLGMQVVLDILDKLQREQPRADHRFTLHHVGYFDEAQARRIRELGAVVTANPYYVWALSGRYAAVGLGPERAARISPLGSLERHGVPLSLHSDLPMAPARPLLLASIAASRINAEGQTMAPTERISVAAALRAITLDAAIPLRLEHEIGSIEAGKRADFTVLAEDPFAVPAEALRDIPIWGTVFEGTPHPLTP